MDRQTDKYPLHSTGYHPFGAALGLPFGEEEGPGVADPKSLAKFKRNRQHPMDSFLNQ